jgi:hypothetical protein
VSDSIVAITEVLATYFDGLYHSDSARLRQVFHPAARYVTASATPLQVWSMDEYFPVVDARPSPAAKGEARRDRVVSVELAGPVTAVARVDCRIAPKSFVDILTLVRVDERWQIISKVFHFELDGEAPAAGAPR